MKEAGRDGDGPVFSIVIPTYNQADFLRAALLSVMAQRFQCFEVVVIDNHSTDHSVEVVRSCSDSRIRLIQIENHGVIAKSRNLGIKEARGPFVAFLDSDDLWHPEKLSRVDHAWRHRDVCLICHDELAVRNGSVVRRLSYGPYQPDMYRFLLLNGSRLSPSAVVVRRTCLEAVGGFSEDPHLAGVEDYDLWLRLSRRCTFYFLHEVLGTFRLHPESYSQNVRRQVDHALYLLNRHFERLEEEGTPVAGALIRKRRAATMRGAGRTFMKQGNHREARRLLVTALQEDPSSWKTWVLSLLNIMHVSP